MRVKRNVLKKIFYISIWPIFFILFYLRKEHIDTQATYNSVGYFTKTGYIRIGKRFYYEYEVDGKTYTSSIDYDKNKFRVDFDKYYLVKVPVGFPGSGRIILDSVIYNYHKNTKEPDK
jgi:hypothetical protein